MIPEIISNHLASLQPERKRLVKTVEIEMLDDLTITHTEVHNAVICSDKRFNYEQIDQYLESPDTFVEDWGESGLQVDRPHARAGDEDPQAAFQAGIAFDGHARHQVGFGPRREG